MRSAAREDGGAALPERDDIALRQSDTMRKKSAIKRRYFMTAAPLTKQSKHSRSALTPEFATVIRNGDHDESAACG